MYCFFKYFLERYKLCASFLIKHKPFLPYLWVIWRKDLLMWKYCVLSKWTFLSINGISTANYSILLFRFFANWYERKFCYHGDVSSLFICYTTGIWLTSFAHILKFSFIDNIRKISLLKVLNWDFLLKILKYWMHKRRCLYMFTL